MAFADDEFYEVEISNTNITKSFLSEPNPETYMLPRETNEFKKTLVHKTSYFYNSETAKDVTETTLTENITDFRIKDPGHIDVGCKML